MNEFVLLNEEAQQCAFFCFCFGIWIIPRDVACYVSTRNDRILKIKNYQLNKVSSTSLRMNGKTGSLLAK